jgi:transglutaminase-like putative cysteine protease
MWTEAFVNGRWVPLDATLGLGGIGVGHIKVADADLSENSAAPVGAFVPIVHLLGKMQVSPIKVE